MPTFDVVSEINLHEVDNAIDQANREVSTRFDFKGTGARFEFKDKTLILIAQVDFQLKQMFDILVNKLVKRGIDIQSLDLNDAIDGGGKEVRQTGVFIEGIETPKAKEIIKIIKEAKLKVKATIMEQKVRIDGKKRDDLQQVIALLKETKLGIPLQYNNFRD